MFSVDIVRSDAFLDMPTSSQLLYFHMGMEADDDGFVDNAKTVARIAGTGSDDFKILLAKRFLLEREGGIFVIKHWKINNYIQSDRHHPTKYLEAKKGLTIKENGAYTECIQPVSRMDTESSLGKVRLGKISNTSASKPADQSFQEFWTAYPRKELKKRSQEIWKNKKLGDKLPVILDFISRAHDTDRWKKGFVKQPTAFLNGECWNDDLASYQDTAIRSQNELATTITKF